MSFSKLAKLNGDWKWIVFSDEEEEAIRSKHRSHCNKIFSECMKDAEAFLDPADIQAKIDIAAVLFSKRADAIFSFMQREIDQAICEMQRSKKE
ncbi:MAG: hypothetical protein E3J56_01090 [Candidatus Aminicenantes bacterium]|nr:MAG: hypothetical protein E3J56_01090 [Candidatus Aminicenantes bacterium]